MISILAGFSQLVHCAGHSSAVGLRACLNAVQLPLLHLLLHACAQEATLQQCHAQVHCCHQLCSTERGPDSCVWEAHGRRMGGAWSSAWGQYMDGRCEICGGAGEAHGSSTWGQCMGETCERLHTWYIKAPRSKISIDYLLQTFSSLCCV